MRKPSRHAAGTTNRTSPGSQGHFPKAMGIATKNTMGKKLNILWSMLAHYKYVIVIVLGVVIVGFVDDNSFVQRIKYDLKISDLKEQIQAYDKRHAENADALHELKRNPKAIEKVAREKYFMKTDDEDVFVLSDDIQYSDNKDEATN